MSMNRLVNTNTDLNTKMESAVAIFSLPSCSIYITHVCAYIDICSISCILYTLAAKNMHVNYGFQS